ncbi:MAG: HigA family addiction module antidote protein [Rhodobacteraceae bacterium]|nr:HigA family addiction module antidote protein [Paracoccaceae bacterium]
MLTTLNSPTTIEAGRIDPIHPGEVLLHEFMAPLGLSANALAGRMGVPANRISTIAAGKRGITGDTALRLAAAFGTTAEFWMNLQKRWELEVARDAFEGRAGFTPPPRDMAG